MPNILDDPTLYIDDFLPSSSTPPEISDFGDSLALLEQTTTSNLSPPPTSFPANAIVTDDTFTALSDSEISSLLHDPHPKTDPSVVCTNKAVFDTNESNTGDKTSTNEPNSPAPSTLSGESIVPAKRRRTYSSSSSSVVEKQAGSLSPTSSSAAVSLQDDMSGCSDCEQPIGKSVPTRKQLEQRLKLSAEENGRLRRRVADLVQENRGLRAHIEELGYAAAAMQNALQTAALQDGSGGGTAGMEKTGMKGETVEGGGSMMVGLATVSKEMAKQLGGMVVIGGKEKKRRRKKVGTAMACVMFMMAALVGVPDYLGGNGGGMLALPGDGVGVEHGLVPTITKNVQARVPRLCEYVVREPTKRAIADNSAGSTIKRRPEQQNAGSLFVKVDDDETQSVLRKEEEPVDDTGAQFSYVLCKDSSRAVAGVESCMRAKNEGKECPKDNVISLIMPMPAAVFDDGSHNENHTKIDGKTTLAEVRCKISSVRRLSPRKSRPSAAVYGGRVIATS